MHCCASLRYRLNIICGEHFNNNCRDKEHKHLVPYIHTKNTTQKYHHNAYRGSAYRRGAQQCVSRKVTSQFIEIFNLQQTMIVEIKNINTNTKYLHKNIYTTYIVEAHSSASPAK